MKVYNVFSAIYSSGIINSNMINSKFHLIQSFFEIFAKLQLFHVQNAQLIKTRVIWSSINSKLLYFKVIQSF